MLEYVGTLRVPIGSTPARVAEGVRNMNLPGTRCIHAAFVVAHRYRSCHFCTDPYPRICTSD
jgi:hypothetical protein